MGSLNRCVGSSSCSMYSLSAFGGGYIGRLNWRRVRSEEFVTRRLKKRQLIISKEGDVRNHRPDLAKSSPFIAPAPEILCRATICSVWLRCRKSRNQRVLTDFVRVLNTSTDPDEVPMKICLPVGSKRATVIADLLHSRHTSVQLILTDRWNGHLRTALCLLVPLPHLHSRPALHKVLRDLYTPSENLPGRPHRWLAAQERYDCVSWVCRGWNAWNKYIPISWMERCR